MTLKVLLLSTTASGALLFSCCGSASGANAVAANKFPATSGQLSSSTASHAGSEDNRSWVAGKQQELVARIAATPEPSSMMLLGTGLLASGFLLRRFNFGDEKETQTASAS